MKEIETLERKLNWWSGVKRKLLITGLVAAGIISGIVKRNARNVIRRMPLGTNISTGMKMSAMRIVRKNVTEMKKVFKI